MAKLTFTLPLVPQSIVSAKIETLNFVDLQKSRMSVTVKAKVSGGGAIDVTLGVRNGACDALVAAANQAGYDIGSVAQATGYDQVMTAIKGAVLGNEEPAALAAMVTLGMLPAGVVA